MANDRGELRRSDSVGRAPLPWQQDHSKPSVDSLPWHDLPLLAGSSSVEDDAVHQLMKLPAETLVRQPTLHSIAGSPPPGAGAAATGDAQTPTPGLPAAQEGAGFLTASPGRARSAPSRRAAQATPSARAATGVPPPVSGNVSALSPRSSQRRRGQAHGQPSDNGHALRSHAVIAPRHKVRASYVRTSTPEQRAAAQKERRLARSGQHHEPTWTLDESAPRRRSRKPRRVRSAPPRRATATTTTPTWDGGDDVVVRGTASPTSERPRSSRGIGSPPRAPPAVASDDESAGSVGDLSLPSFLVSDVEIPSTRDVVEARRRVGRVVAQQRKLGAGCASQPASKTLVDLSGLEVVDRTADAALDTPDVTMLTLRDMEVFLRRSLSSACTAPTAVHMGHAPWSPRREAHNGAHRVGTATSSTVISPLGGVHSRGPAVPPQPATASTRKGAASGQVPTAGASFVPTVVGADPMAMSVTTGEPSMAEPSQLSFESWLDSSMPSMATPPYLHMPSTSSTASITTRGPGPGDGPPPASNRRARPRTAPHAALAARSGVWGGLASVPRRVPWVETRTNTRHQKRGRVSVPRRRKVLPSHVRGMVPSTSTSQAFPPTRGSKPVSGHWLDGPVGGQPRDSTMSVLQVAESVQTYYRNKFGMCHGRKPVLALCRVR